MAALAYRDDKILARNLLLRRFFCLTPAEPFFRPDRSTTAPSCRVAVKDGRAFRGHLKGLSLYEAFEVKHYFTPFFTSSFQFLCSSAPGDRQEVGGESPPR